MSEIEQNPQSVTPLADRFEALVKEFFTVVDEATATLKEYHKRNFERSANDDLESRSHKLVQIKLELSRWKLNLVYGELVPEKMCVKRAGEILFVVESCQMSVGEDLHKVFNQMEMNLATLSKASQSLSRDVQEEW